MSKAGKRQRPIPQRTCVGCRTVRPKRELLRIVRTPEGAIEIDPGGKQSGRGAYLCRQQVCWETALKRDSLGRALKTSLDATTQTSLHTYAQTLPKELES
jgi:hypothetical protein